MRIFGGAGTASALPKTIGDAGEDGLAFVLSILVFFVVKKDPAGRIVDGGSFLRYEDS